MMTRMQRHKILAFLLALLVSIGLWVYAVTIVNPNDVASISDVRVRLVGSNELLSRNLMITGGEEQFVDVEVSGRRSDLKELNSTSLEATADVSNIDGAGTFEVSWKLDPPASVASGDIKLVGSSSNKITIKVSEVMTRPSVPVEVEYVGKPAEGYVRDPAILNRESISITGPAEEVAGIAKALVRVDLSGATQSLSAEMQYELLNGKGEVLTLSNYVTVDAESIQVKVPVLCYKQVELLVNFAYCGGVSAENVKCTIDPPIIGVTGSQEALAGLDTLIIKEIDLSKVDTGFTLTVTPELPAGVSNRAEQQSVEITVSLVGVYSRKITIPCARIERMNDNPMLEFATSNISVVVRGPLAKVYDLTVGSLKITADMTGGYDPATKTVALKVSLSGSTECGVFGDYSVQVVERQPETTEEPLE